MTETVRDWATDYDVFDPAYVADPFSIWDELRETCPIAHTERLGGSWLPTTYDDVTAIARDVERFSSRNVGVVPPTGDDQGLLPVGLPPISADPPVHTWTRRLLLPLVLQQSSRRVRGLHPRAVPATGRRFHRVRPCRRSR